MLQNSNIFPLEKIINNGDMTLKSSLIVMIVRKSITLFSIFAPSNTKRHG